MPIPRNDANERSERIFHPKPSPAPLGGAFICAAFLLAVLAIPFLGETLSGEDYLIVIGGSILFSFLTFLFLKTHHLSKTVYKCDVVGVGAVNGDKEKFVAWSDIAAIDCSHSLGGSGELRVDLLDANKRKLVSIKTEHLPRGGRDMLDYLHHRLAPLFDAKADCYLKGDDHWAFSVIRDVVKIEERNLLVEYPKNKKLIIPFSELRRVEWLPGVISGGKAGHVIIDHQEGSLELPQMIKGMQYFIYALKCRCGLSCVNPERPPEVTEKLDELRRKSGRRKLGLLAGAMLFLGMFLPMGIIVWEWIKDSQTKTIGKSVQAVVTEKKSNEVVVLEYTDPQGKHRENDARVEKNFYDTIKKGAKLTIKVHPFFGAQIDFKEKTPMNMTTLLTLFVICAVLSFIGLSIFILSLRGSGKMKLEIAELDAVRLKPEEPVPPSEGSASNGPPPLPTANITAPAACQALKSESAAALVEPTPDKENADQERVESPAIDDPNNEPISAFGKPDPGEISTAPAAFQSEIKTCASCGKSIEEEYFLAAGAPWCRDCRGKRVDSATKPGCLILLCILVFGLTAAFLGGGLWALIVIVTGYELGLVAVLVGLLVGYSVKAAAKGYSGRLCQVAAVLLTFIGLSYSTIPMMVNEYRKNPDKYLEQFKKSWEKGRKNSESSELGELDKKASEKQVPESRKTENGSATPDTGEVRKIDKVTGRIKENSGENDGQTGKTLKDGKSMPRANPPAESGNAFLKLLLGILLLLLGILLLFVAPIIIYVLFLFTSPFSAIFAAIALWEAWRINKREEVHFQGPFKLDEEEIDLDKADFDVEKS